MENGVDKIRINPGNSGDIEKIKMISKKIDPESFIIVTDAREVYGLGFK